MLTLCPAVLMTTSCATAPYNEWDESFADKADGFGDCVLDSGESGECMDTADCAAASGASYPGYCPGASNIQCCVGAGTDDSGSARDEPADDGSWDEPADDGSRDEPPDDGSRDEPEDAPPPRESYQCTFFCFTQFRLDSSWDCHGAHVGEVERLETTGSTMTDAYHAALDICGNLLVAYEMGSELCDWWSWGYDSRITQQRYFYYLTWVDRARPANLDSVCRAVAG